METVRTFSVFAVNKNWWRPYGFGKLFNSISIIVLYSIFVSLRLLSRSVILHSYYFFFVNLYISEPVVSIIHIFLSSIKWVSYREIKTLLWLIWPWIKKKRKRKMMWVSFINVFWYMWLYFRTTSNHLNFCRRGGSFYTKDQAQCQFYHTTLMFCKFQNFKYIPLNF